MRVEHEYTRRGTCAYQAAWDVHRAKVFGQVVEESTIETFDALVARVMRREPYRSASRVFWIVDNGTVHRGERARRRLRKQWPRLQLVHLPIHASWLNQIEICFSLLARKALTPIDFHSRGEVEARIMGFQRAAAIEEEPARLVELLAEQGWTAEAYEALLVEIAADPRLTDVYEAARTGPGPRPR